MTKEVIEFGRVLSRARADLDDINRRGQGDMTPVTRKLTEAELRYIMPEEPEPAPEPVWPMLLTVAAGAALAFAIGYGLQSFWLEGM